MSAPMAFKRRRLNETVNKPFKSPIRGPLKPTSAIPNASPLANSPLNASNPVSKPLAVALERSRAPSTPTALRKAPTRPALPTSNELTDPKLASTIQHAVQENRKLERQILQTKQDVDLLGQALAIVHGGGDAELDALEEKWRGAARLAAEELFASARDRVNRMGGVHAWRDGERERRERVNGWFSQDDGGQKPQESSDVDEDDEDGKTREHGTWDYDFTREGDEGTADEETERARQRKKEEDEYDADNNGFTMDMMLRSLGISLELIGYSKDRQMWVG